jgi:DivIVA domain-containing protein
MELTPELFEKIEFAERRRGYDTEQVETFLEEAGTALAQLMVRVRHTEERAAAAEARLSEADARINAAEERAARAEAHARQASQARPAAAPSPDDAAEVQQAGRVLAMAKRTADEVVAEARTQAQHVLGEAKARADRQLAEAQAEAEELIRRARSQADSEFAERRQRAQEDVQALEIRRSQLGDIITQLEARLAGYRQDLSRTAEELTLLASDPDRLGARPNLSIPPDEVFQPDEVAPPAPAADQPEESGPSGSGAGADAGDAQEDAGPATEAMATPVPEAGDGEDWGPGSWSRVEAREAQPEAEPEEPRVDLSRSEPEVQQGGRDRYLQELDEAVNDSGPDDDAMTAFFEGGEESRARRFGWRR